MIIMVVMTGTHPYSPLYDILNVILYTLYYNDMIITIIIHHHTTNSYHIIFWRRCRGSSVSLLSLSFTHYTHYSITPPFFGAVAGEATLFTPKLPFNSFVYRNSSFHSLIVIAFFH
jgi:hypothetical protein